MFYKRINYVWGYSMAVGKRGVVLELHQLQGISLMSLVGKLYNSVLLNRIRGKIQPLL